MAVLNKVDLSEEDVMKQWPLWCICLVMVLMSGSCALHGTADEWNGLVNVDGKKVYLDSTTKVGFNFFVVIPGLGKTNLDGMVKEATKSISEKGGNYLRVVQGSSENYWYGLPPLSWIITPVISTLTVEYRPSRETLYKLEKQALDK